MGEERIASEASSLIDMEALIILNYAFAAPHSNRVFPNIKDAFSLSANKMNRLNEANSKEGGTEDEHHVCLQRVCRKPRQKRARRFLF
jgi:hypothetical protein